MNPAERRDTERPDEERREATTALSRACRAQDGTDSKLAQLLYEDLRKLADGLLRRERRDHTLQPTALVHEAWVRLVDEPTLEGSEREDARSKFLAHAVQAMRRVLIDHARRHTAQKRGGGAGKVPLIDLPMMQATSPDDLIALDDALKVLTKERPRSAELAQLRIYGGLSTAEAATILGVSFSTAKTEWSLAQALLSKLVRSQD